MRYVEARIDENNREAAYRFYVTKSLQLAPQSKALSIDYFDMLKPRVVDTRTGDDIAADIMQKAGLKFGD